MNYSIIIIIVMKVYISLLATELDTWLTVKTQSSVSFYIIYVSKVVTMGMVNKTGKVEMKVGT